MEAACQTQEKEGNTHVSARWMQLWVWSHDQSRKWPRVGKPILRLQECVTALKTRLSQLLSTITSDLTDKMSSGAAGLLQLRLLWSSSSGV